MDVDGIKAIVQKEFSNFRKRMNLELSVFEKEVTDALEKLSRRKLNIGPVGDVGTVRDRTTEVFSGEEGDCMEQDVDTSVSGITSLDSKHDLDLSNMMSQQKDAVENVVGEQKSSTGGSSNNARSLLTVDNQTRADTPDVIVEGNRAADIEGKYMEVTPIKKESNLDKILCKDEKEFTMASSMASYTLAKAKTSNRNDPLRCLVIGCSYRTDTGLKLRVHIRNKHTKEEIFQCPYCPKKFRNKDTTNKHVRKHWDMALDQCEECFEFLQIGKQHKCKQYCLASVV